FGKLRRQVGSQIVQVCVQLFERRQCWLRGLVAHFVFVLLFYGLNDPIDCRIRLTFSRRSLISCSVSTMSVVEVSAFKIAASFSPCNTMVKSIAASRLITALWFSA